MGVLLNIPRIVQLNDECGVACLKQVLDYFNVRTELTRLVDEVSTNSVKWRDWDYKMGVAALKKGCIVRVYTRSLDVFDPSWFNVDKKELVQKLRQELKYFEELKENLLPWAIPELKSAIEFLNAGGEIRFEPITKELIKTILDERIPVIASVDYTLLRELKRVYKDEIDDVRGCRFGHVVVVAGYNDHSFIIVDPSQYVDAPYEVKQDILIDAILRRDQNITVIRPK